MIRENLRLSYQRAYGLHISATVTEAEVMKKLSLTVKPGFVENPVIAVSDLDLGNEYQLDDGAFQESNVFAVSGQPAGTSDRGTLTTRWCTNIEKIVYVN
jgi:hypothetical protein